MSNVNNDKPLHINYPLIEYNQSKVTLYENDKFGSWIIVDVNADDYSPHGTSYFSGLASHIFQGLQTVAASTIRGIIYAVSSGSQLSGRIVTYTATTLSNNEQSIRQSLLTTAQLAKNITQHVASQGPTVMHALGTLGHVSSQTAGTLAGTAMRHGPLVINYLAMTTDQVVRSARQLAVDHGPLAANLLITIGNVSASAAGITIVAARTYGPDVIAHAHNTVSLGVNWVGNELRQHTPQINIQNLRLNNYKAIGSEEIEMTSLIMAQADIAPPQTASLEVLEDQEELEEKTALNELVATPSFSEDLAFNNDLDPLLGRIAVTRLSATSDDADSSLQSPISNAEAQKQLNTWDAASNVEPPAPKGLVNRFLTSIGNGFSAALNAVRSAVAATANAFLYVVTFKWLRGQ